MAGPLAGLGVALKGGAKFAATQGVQARLIRGARRGIKKSRDRIQQGLFGKGEGGGMIGGGPLAIGSSSSIGSAIPTSQESIGQVPTGTGTVSYTHLTLPTICSV